MEKDKILQNYYDILNVRRDCSDKDIKVAYVQLSKKFHPDVSKAKTAAQQTARFQQISEAYQTLSKPKLRLEYDRNLKAARSIRAYETSSSSWNEIHRPWEIKPNYDPNPGPYYGVKGLNKTSNFKVALALVGMGIFCGAIGFVALKRSFFLKQKHLDEISSRANEHHQKIRSEVEKQSQSEQLRRVIDRIASHAER